MKLSLGFRLRRTYYISDVQCASFLNFFQINTFQVEFCKKILRFHANKSISQLKNEFFAEASCLMLLFFNTILV